MILFFSDFSDFKKYFYRHFYESNENLNKLFCIGKRRLNAPTALGHMLMPSAQRWADKQCYRRIPPPPPPGPDYKTPINGDCFHVPWSRLLSHRLRRGNL